MYNVISNEYFHALRVFLGFWIILLSCLFHLIDIEHSILGFLISKGFEVFPNGVLYQIYVAHTYLSMHSWARCSSAYASSAVQITFHYYQIFPRSVDVLYTPCWIAYESSWFSSHYSMTNTNYQVARHPSQLPTSFAVLLLCLLADLHLISLHNRTDKVSCLKEFHGGWGCVIHMFKITSTIWKTLFYGNFIF